MKESRKTFVTELIVAIIAAGLAALIFFTYTLYLREKRGTETNATNVIEIE